MLCLTSSVAKRIRVQHGKSQIVTFHVIKCCRRQSSLHVVSCRHVHVSYLCDFFLWRHVVFPPAQSQVHLARPTTTPSLQRMQPNISSHTNTYRNISTRYQDNRNSCGAYHLASLLCLRENAVSSFDVAIRRCDR